ncbi:MAG: DNA polymerase III epsilon subunit [uncultured bacterium]|nr:MAG: DNA polymerase III epsilon subunit [uncultured bacterium]OGT26201.1 MAG: DNA polymerase III subunit epsilon [Gammaproteobacteria bacterium RIFCSPHIGHO2_02_FULL_42_43]OGT28503.1 MAG: DNA polymerase III subunit epsilon [Gammaproteobacteria bacterium RIFCSPHIGHO2_01_FULL_42_8]OGT52579.1 MAG: DNA polymerase III subunit epsilon [Gammaproteobacteria bacterium RIFCSPHIGHO2_12_FULL_41_25]OGT63177.1 MAG: DNA polymerase III subunit epsilon [Gammaproteobacteria bacterium RIFCSPLOWO2_02_FULL_42_14]
MRQIVLDTETTGLEVEEGHRLIEIGCIEMVNRRFTNRHFHFYVNPDHAVDLGAMKVHGITNEFLKDKPRFANIADALLNFIANAELIIHNAEFDLGFLTAEFTRLKIKWKPSSVIDTLSLARNLHPGQKNSLDILCKRYGVDNTQRDLHGALLDAKLLASVYLQMTSGQTQLFDESSVKVTTVLQDHSTKSVFFDDLPVIAPTEEELAAHKTATME